MRFLLVDCIESITRGQSARGIKSVTASEDFFTHHFPDRPIMPGALMLESLVQLADFLIRDESDFARTGMLADVHRLKLRRLVIPGDRLELSVEVTGREEERIRFASKVTVAGASTVSADFELTTSPLAAVDDPERARRWFKTISGRPWP
jgi:3-hydroxyacyl-[acyl-carrier-protein] dehydratase